MSQISHIKNSLNALDEVFEGVKDYRVLGSLLVASLNGKPHRELHDIDLLVDEREYKTIVAKFERAGFKRVNKHAPGFSWDEFEKAGHLKFGVLLRGAFGKDYFEYKVGRWFTLQIKNTYLTPTNYTLYGLSIRGIPLRSVYEGIKVASLNSKRNIDKKVVLAALDNELPEGLSLSQAFRVKLFGTHIPYLYTLFSQVYNLIGGVRLKLGKSYDPWK